MTAEKDAVATVAGLMALAARTAPKGKGQDEILITVLTDVQKKKVATAMQEYGTKNGVGFFLRDAGNVAASDACIVIGARGKAYVGINCGACGYPTCAAFAKATGKAKTQNTPFAGPNCAVRMTDLGIAVGSAAKTAQIHNVDNRIMYSAGSIAMALGFLGRDCTAAYAIPLSVSGKSIYFDRPTSK
ncbi:Fe-S cluster domain protein [Methanoregula boonei 6A8]|jgi:uncharacterized ferredoxin-like protein|uniref:Fe-S cluster domain protein n=1 Tax=Methanoregula boonei (strain DSM 21154 / JCM 14090 / 6A8) TaxID=456442 RepID=A7I8A6_METB6|nr:DUF2148 domain-containing protein [Methanoregula boonei]ABS55967.1 Fe-S cluster domain protein [Methanoregula boonei 6A8]